ncbi:hypothetical protein C8J57DRAFT_1520912 [Mycena rebaudengoi]|nr:hypothetical protein C8J57DRAFT_1520912 [Mycena rebaudengoi]
MPYIPVPSRRLHSSHSSSSSTSCWPVPSLPLPSPVLRPLHAWSPLCHSPLPPFRRPTRPLAHSYFLIPRSSLHPFHLPLPPLSVQPGSSIRLSAIVTRRTPQPEPFTHSHFTLPRSPAVSRDLGPLSLHSSARYFCIHLTARAASPSDPPLSRITLHTPASRCLFSFLLLLSTQIPAVLYRAPLHVAHRYAYPTSCLLLVNGEFLIKIHLLFSHKMHAAVLLQSFTSS